VTSLLWTAVSHGGHDTNGVITVSSGGAQQDIYKWSPADFQGHEVDVKFDKKNGTPPSNVLVKRIPITVATGDPTIVVVKYTAGHHGVVTFDLVLEVESLGYHFHHDNTPESLARTGRTFLLESALGGVFAHVLGAQTANGTQISLWSFVNQDNLKWTLKPAEVPGFYYIVSALDRKVDRVLHQLGAVQDNGGHVTLWERVNQGNTQVRFEDAGDGYWYIIFHHSGKYVHVQGAVKDNNTPITQWEKVNQNNLKWRFVVV